VILLAAAYYGAAQAGYALQYTGSATAAWPPVGLGIGALYLAGLRWWPGVLVGDLFANDPSLPLESALGQTTGNMGEIIVGALILRRVVGQRAAMDRLRHVAGVVLAVSVGAAISASVAMPALRAGGVIERSEMAEFWRTWWLGDTSGGLVILPLMLAWAAGPRAAWRRLRTAEGALLIATVVGLSLLALSGETPVTYVVFPALIWAALRFGAPGATLCVFIAVGLLIGITASDVGPFSEQSVDHQTLSTQLYIAVAALTTLCLSAIVSERERSAAGLAEAQAREGRRAAEERRRIARELHDSVSQALFSTGLQARAAQAALAKDEAEGTLGQALSEIGDLTRTAQHEMRSLILELGHEAVAEGGLVAALDEHASRLGAREGLAIEVEGPPRLPLPLTAQDQLYSIVREALANVIKHSQATTARVRVRGGPSSVVVEVEDNGVGFDPTLSRPANFGLDSMRSRTADLGGTLTIASEPGRGTTVRVEIPSPETAALER
jgi:signal transduction histidine kinase